MKNLLYIIIALFISSCTANKSKKQDEKIVKGILSEFIEAVQNKSYSTIDQLTHSDFVIYENGLVWGVEEFSLKLEEYENVDIKYEMSDLHLIVDNKTAHAQFHNKGTFNYPDTVIVLKFIDSATLVKENDNWVIKFYHSTHLQ